jgi:hypothetical protein
VEEVVKRWRKGEEEGETPFITQRLEPDAMLGGSRVE